MNNFTLGQFNQVVATGIKSCHVGEFQSVIAAGLGTHVVSILNCQGVEHLLPIKPVFDYDTGEFEALPVEGEFGSFETAAGSALVEGFAVDEVTKVTITKSGDDDPSWDFHHRTLRIFTGSGQSLTWTLQCIGSPK
jgi:hypothetical protein